MTNLVNKEDNVQTPRTDALIERLQTPAGGLCEGADVALIALARDLERCISDSALSRPAWYTTELEEILGLLADTLKVRRYDADALLAAAKREVEYAQEVTAVAEGLRDEFGTAEWASFEHAEEILRGLIKSYYPKLTAALAKNLAPAQETPVTRGAYEEHVARFGDPAQQQHSQSNSRPSPEWYRRKIEEAGDDAPAVIGAGIPARTVIPPGLRCDVGMGTELRSTDTGKLALIAANGTPIRFLDRFEEDFAQAGYAMGLAAKTRNEIGGRPLNIYVYRGVELDPPAQSIEEAKMRAGNGNAI